MRGTEEWLLPLQKFSKDLGPASLALIKAMMTPSWQPFVQLQNISLDSLQWSLPGKEGPLQTKADSVMTQLIRV